MWKIKDFITASLSAGIILLGSSFKHCFSWLWFLNHLCNLQIINMILFKIFSTCLELNEYCNTAIWHIIDYCSCQGEYEAQCSICGTNFHSITDWGCTFASCKKVARHCLVCDFPNRWSPTIILHSSLSKLSFLCRSSDTQIRQQSSKRCTKCIFLRNKFIFLWLAKRL